MSSSTVHPPTPPKWLTTRDLHSIALLTTHPALALPALVTLTAPPPISPLPIEILTLLEGAAVPAAEPDPALLANMNIAPSRSDDDGAPRLTLGSRPDVDPPSIEEMVKAFNFENQVGFTAGGRALTKHAHRDEAFWAKVTGSATCQHFQTL